MLKDHYHSALVRTLHKKQARPPAHAPAIKPSRDSDTILGLKSGDAQS
jgi:hypothetical protein